MTLRSGLKKEEKLCACESAFATPRVTALHHLPMGKKCSHVAEDNAVICPGRL